MVEPSAAGSTRTNHGDGTAIVNNASAARQQFDAQQLRLDIGREIRLDTKAEVKMHLIPPMASPLFLE